VATSIFRNPGKIIKPLYPLPLPPGEAVEKLMAGLASVLRIDLEGPADGGGSKR
jgi:hypothetical protein